MASAENLTPAVIKRLSKEFASLSSNPLEGIKLLINTDNLTDVQAWLQGPEGTPYEGGAFRVRLALGADFPDSPPTGTFLTKIFHPNVSRTGEICVNVLKKEWKKELGIGDILMTVKCLLIDPNPESALNEEAGRLLLEDYASYAKHAKLMTSLHALNRPVQFGPSSSSPPPSPSTNSGKPPVLKQSTSATSQENALVGVNADRVMAAGVAAGGGAGRTAEAAEVLGVNNGPTSPKRKLTAVTAKSDKKRTLKRL
ncbi:ubiquitin-conjugating enzyme E2 S [Thoreauomyces humboldtii]|nr:ubiquitin-conjugating enzyme E2 S [Thoreauomyces humboldtii]